MENGNGTMPRFIESFDQTIDFGKHKGKTVNEVIGDDPGYLLWIAQETDMDINPQIVDAAQDAFDDETFGNY